MENHGLIIRNLRTLAGLSVQTTARKLGKSVGWLSEIENNRGTSRLTEKEFQRIVDLLNGNEHRAMFKIWVANHKNRERADKTFEGAVLKFMRLKKSMTLDGAALKSGLSASLLSKLETGAKPVTLELRNRILSAYGYSPSSWKNLATDPMRSKAVPLSYKLRILLAQLGEDQTADVFNYVYSLLVGALESRSTGGAT